VIVAPELFNQVSRAVHTKQPDGGTEHQCHIGIASFDGVIHPFYQLDLGQMPTLTTVLAPE